MKISYRTHPILEDINKGKLLGIRINPVDEVRVKPYIDNFIKSFDKNVLYFKNVTHISKTFTDAALLSLSKFDKMLEDYTNNFGYLEVDGTYILGDTTYLVSLKKESICCFTFIKGSVLDSYFEINGVDVEIWASTRLIIQGGSGCKFSNEEECTKYISIICNLFWCISLFKKYATVETKLLKAGQVKKELSCKYVNDTNLDILHLDCKWFTTLVKSDGFNVRGHFRLQPFGEKLKDRKIIWVDSFEKTGYTSPAKKLSHD